MYPPYSSVRPSQICRVRLIALSSYPNFPPAALVAGNGDTNSSLLQPCALLQLVFPKCRYPIHWHRRDIGAVMRTIGGLPRGVLITHIIFRIQCHEVRGYVVLYWVHGGYSGTTGDGPVDPGKGVTNFGQRLGPTSANT